MMKLDLKDAYFCIPLAENAKKYVRFYWKGNVYQFLCLCFGLSPAPYIFTKRLKVPMAFLRCLGTLIIIYLGDMLFRDTVILLLEELGYVINQEKSVMILTQVIEFLGMTINSKTITISYNFHFIATRESSEDQDKMPGSI